MSTQKEDKRCQRFWHGEKCNSDFNVQYFKGEWTCEACYDEYIHEVSE